ncbi:MAG: hypothetical protein WBI63_07370 [Coriobacteriia bacterium]
MDSYPTDRYGNPAICHECGGLCCALYLAHDENGQYIGHGWLPEYIELWLGRFVASGALRAATASSGSDLSACVTQTAYVAGDAGVEPLHDPRLSHLPTSEGEAYRATLPVWVDVRKCQFCHPESGCLLSAEYRAPICHEYTCELWRSAE